MVGGADVVVSRSSNILTFVESPAHSGYDAVLSSLESQVRLETSIWQTRRKSAGLAELTLPDMVVHLR